MRSLDVGRCALGACVVAMLAGCGGANSGLDSSMPTAAAPQVVAPSLPPTTANLYVANGVGPSVTVYARGRELIRTITQGVNNPDALAFASSGDLYIANDGCKFPSCKPIASSTVTVYAPGTITVLRTIAKGVDNPAALAFDGSGDLYVANVGCPTASSCKHIEPSTVTVYAPGSTKVLRTIAEGIDQPDAEAFDASGNLYVANYETNSVTVYAPNSTKVLRTIENGVQGPDALAFDGSGDLYVANYPCQFASCRNVPSSVTVYAPGSSKVLRTISQGVTSAFALAFDRSGNLYVANNANGNVTDYAPGSTKLLHTIEKGVAVPNALAFDRSDNLYVGNGGCGPDSCNRSEAPTITVYAARSVKLLHTIKKGVAGPAALAFGP